MNNRNLRTFAVLALMGTGLAACSDDDGTGPLMAEITVDAQQLDFGSLDVEFGAGLPQTITITNSGSGAASIGGAAFLGVGSGDYRIIEGGAAGTLAAGESRDIVVAFDPTAPGSRGAQLAVTVEGGGSVLVSLSGSGATFTHAQVDRVGIPTLNTVFNHPPQFSKTAYNVAKPVNDDEAYTGLFETVLGAVANPNPAATADLLLPDALPVNMGAQTTTFAQLTGRALADDAVDVALMVTVGIESLHSDNVDSNDKAFLGTFPYLATAH